MLNLIGKLIPESLKKAIRRKAGAPDIFLSLQRLKGLGFSPSCILDVGAFQGDWTRECLTLFPDAKYLMVEPQESKKPKLDRLVASHKNVSYETALVGASDGQEVFFAEIETASSVLEENVATHARVKKSLRTLNSLVEKNGITKVDLIKLDVQGYELEVLKGFSKYLPSTEVVIAEANLLDIHKDVPLVKDVLNFMAERDFALHDICSVSTRRPLDNALWTTDLLFVKTNSRFRSDKRYASN